MTENNSTCNNEIGNSDNSSVSYSLQSRYGYTDNSDPVTDADVQAEVSFSCSYRLAMVTFSFLRFYMIVFTNSLYVDTWESIIVMFS